MLLRRLGDLAVALLPITAGPLDAAWALRDNVAAPSALYAAAQALSADLVTTDDRLDRITRGRVPACDRPLCQRREINVDITQRRLDGKQLVQSLEIMNPRKLDLVPD